jgi:pectate lyase
MPDDVSTIIDVLSILMVVTLRAEEKAARWQSGHKGWAATKAARSTGEDGGGAEAETAAACRVLAAKV